VSESDFGTSQIRLGSLRLSIYEKRINNAEISVMRGPCRILVEKLEGKSNFEDLA